MSNYTTEVRFFKSSSIFQLPELGHYLYFDSKDKRDNYILGIKPDYKDMFPHRYYNEKMIIQYPYEEAQKFTYLTYQNPNERRYFAFISDVKPLMGNKLCEITFYIDIFQTYFYDVKFENTFIERQHTKDWKTVTTDGQKYELPHWETREIETLYTGDSYKVEYEENIIPNSGIISLVLVFSKIPLSENSDLDSPPQDMYSPLNYMVIPIDTTNFNRVFYTESGSRLINYREIITLLSSSKLWVGFAENIFTTEFLTDSLNIKSYNGGYKVSGNNLLDTGDITTETNAKRKFLIVNKVTANKNQLSRYNSGYVYKGVKKETTSQLLRFPYTKIVMTDYKGNVQEYKPELFKDGTIKVGVMGSIGNFNKVQYLPYNYIQTASKSLHNMAYAVYGFQNTLPTDLPIKSEYLATYLQGQQNQIKAQRENAQNDFNTANSNAMLMTNGSNTMNRNNINFAGSLYGDMVGSVTQNAQISGRQQGEAYGRAVGGSDLVSGVSNMANGVFNSFNGVTGGISGAIGGVVTGSVDYANQQYGIAKYGDRYSENAVTMAQNSLQSQHDRGVKSAKVGAQNASIQTGMATAMMVNSARTSLANTQRLLNATLSDAKNIPASIKNMGGNSFFDLENGIHGIFIRKETIQEDARKYIRSFYNEQGQMFNRFDTINFNSRDKFNYVKTAGIIVKGDVPQSVRTFFEDLFNKGVYFWHDYYNIGKTTITNLEKSDVKKMYSEGENIYIRKLEKEINNVDNKSTFEVYNEEKGGYEEWTIK